MLVPYEDRVTGVDLTDDELQVAQGSPITDGDGTRRATLLLEPGTEATATLPDGTEKELGDRLNIRATEFTIGANGPAAMPGELPPTSAYTYAVEYSIDEADKDQAVERRVRQADRHLRRQHRRLQGRHAGPDGLLRPREGAVDRRARTAS